MTKTLHRFPLLQRLLRRPSSVEIELREANQAHEKRIKALGASLAFLTNTLNSANDGVLAIHFSSGAKYVNPRFTEMWGQAPEALMAPGQEIALMTQHATLVKDGAQFIARALELWASLDSEVFDEMEMKDGRLIETNTFPSHPPEEGGRILGNGMTCSFGPGGNNANRAPVAGEKDVSCPSKL